jgi:hypothetical protein
MLPVMSNARAAMKSILIRNKIYFMGRERKDAPRCLFKKQDAGAGLRFSACS